MCYRSGGKGARERDRVGGNSERVRISPRCGARRQISEGQLEGARGVGTVARERNIAASETARTPTGQHRALKASCRGSRSMSRQRIDRSVRNCPSWKIDFGAGKVCTFRENDSRLGRDCYVGCYI